MGWCNESFPGHEGYVVAFVMREPGSYTWRELAYPVDDKDILDIKCIAVGCDCGWRSPRLSAPRGTRWAPFSVVLRDETDEDYARELWSSHCESLRGVQVRDGVAGSLRSLAEALRGQ